MRQLIVDTETTGLDPKLGHRIIEFAALEMIDRQLSGKYLHLYINPERIIDAGAMAIHGITNQMLEDKPKFAEIATTIMNYIQGAQLIIHNAKFDVGFLDHHFKNYGTEKKIATMTTEIIDTLVMARQKFPGAKNNLNALCDRFKINRTNRNYHGALIDCELLAAVYIALTQEQISLLNENLEEQSAKIKFIGAEGIIPNLLINPSADELQAHNVFLHTLNLNWSKN